MDLDRYLRSRWRFFLAERWHQIPGRTSPGQSEYREACDVFGVNLGYWEDKMWCIFGKQTNGLGSENHQDPASALYVPIAMSDVPIAMSACSNIKNEE